jgi:hypothetical protein
MAHKTQHTVKTMAKRQASDTKNKPTICSSCKKEGKIHIINSIGICERCIRSLIILSKNTEYALSLADTFLSTTLAELLQINKHQAFDFEKFSIGLQKLRAEHSNNLFELIALFSKCFNDARLVTVQKELEIAGRQTRI